MTLCLLDPFSLCQRKENVVTRKLEEGWVSTSSCCHPCNVSHFITVLPLSFPSLLLSLLSFTPLGRPTLVFHNYSIHLCHLPSLYASTLFPSSPPSLPSTYPSLPPLPSTLHVPDPLQGQKQLDGHSIPVEGIRQWRSRVKIIPCARLSGKPAGDRSTKRLLGSPWGGECVHTRGGGGGWGGGGGRGIELWRWEKTERREGHESSGV